MCSVWCWRTVDDSKDRERTRSKKKKGRNYMLQLTMTAVEVVAAAAVSQRNVYSIRAGDWCIRKRDKPSSIFIKWIFFSLLPAQYVWRVRQSHRNFHYFQVQRDLFVPFYPKRMLLETFCVFLVFLIGFFFIFAPRQNSKNIYFDSLDLVSRTNDDDHQLKRPEARREL